MWPSAWRMTFNEGLPISASAAAKLINALRSAGLRTSASTIASAASAPYFSSDVIDAARTVKSSESRSLRCFLISSFAAGGGGVEEPGFILTDPGCGSIIGLPPPANPYAPGGPNKLSARLGKIIHSSGRDSRVAKGIPKRFRAALPRRLIHVAASRDVPGAASGKSGRPLRLRPAMRCEGREKGWRPPRRMAGWRDVDADGRLQPRCVETRDRAA